MNCNMCPRKCNIDRNTRLGFCGQREKVRISKVMLHHFEEPCISGDETMKGSGAIFFAGCNLKCVYCQNYPISHKNKGKDVSIKKLAKIFKKLEKKGALNINLVTPTHYQTQIVEALKIYKPNIPIVWNSSGYESQESIQKLKDYVDIFLVDMKYMDNNLARKYSNAENYVENCIDTILTMKKLIPNNEFASSIMKHGLIIRHLILPGLTEDSLRVLDWISDNIGQETIVSLMSQYEPRYGANKFPEINRKITPLEYKRVIAHALKLNLLNCYTQDLSSADSKYTPKF